MNKAKVILDYVKSLEMSTGGIRTWPGGLQYPEVTGYIIPTLLDYGERKMAFRCANWLATVQNKDGSFNGPDGIPRAFDTAAVMEGLESTKGWYQESRKARKWLKKQVRSDGAIKIHPKTNDTHLYTMRVSALLDSKAGAKYWMKVKWESTREHYVAYALEGLWKMGYREFVKDKLKERDWSSDELWTNAQFAILAYEAGINHHKYYNYVERHYKNIVNSWTTKWILDMWKVIGD